MLCDERSRASLLAHALALTVLAAAVACAPGAESPTIEAEVLIGEGADAPFVDDAGWSVSLQTCRAAISDLRFTTGGEVHERSWVSAIRRLAIADAWAHPGHAAGGEVIGELAGRRIVDWCAAGGAELGTAELTFGDYSGADFVFVRGAEADGLAADDPLIGHSLEVGGEATLDGITVEFHALITQDEGREVLGVPMDVVVDGSAALELDLHVLSDRLLEGIDFAALADGAGEIVELSQGDENYNRLLRASQSHESYAIKTEP